MPKGRYRIMRDYMPKVGRYGLDMMFRTCTVQDQSRLLVRSRHGQEAAGLGGVAAGCDGAVRKFSIHRRQAERLPVVPFGNLARHRQRPRRHDPLGVRGRHGFERWVDYALDVPMYFVKRGENYIDVSGSSFRDFFDGKNKTHPRRAAEPCWTGPIICRQFSRRCGSSGI